MLYGGDGGVFDVGVAVVYIYMVFMLFMYVWTIYLTPRGHGTPCKSFMA